MKLVNQSIWYISGSLLFIMGIWCVFFYYNILREIKESVDEELENYKREIIYKAEKNPQILARNNFDEGFFSFQEIPKNQALGKVDLYSDTMIFMQDRDDENPELEPVRMLVTTFEQKGHYYELRIFNSMLEEDDLVKEMLKETLLLYGALLFVLIFVNNIILRKLWKPFYSILKQLRNYRLGSNVQFEEVSTNTLEFNALQTTVKNLLNHTNETYDHQKTFIGNASHELQTPLAISITKLELMLERENFTPSQALHISEVLESLDRMVRLNKTLLLLTKIENHQIIEKEEINISDTIEIVKENFQELAEFHQLTLHLKVEDYFTVEMNPSLLTILISNLFKNAILHSPKKSEISIQLKNKILIVSNQSKGEELNSFKIFNRFYKTNDSQDGTGLGLAIAQSICKVYNLKLGYNYLDKNHHFSLDFNSFSSDLHY